MSTPEELASLPHDDRGPAILVTHWLLTGLAGVFLGLRLYCKSITKRKLWWDDWILISSMVLILATDIVTTIMVAESGLGKHSWDLKIDNLTRWIIIISARATFTITTSGWTKTSFAFTLLRLTTDWTKAFVWFIIISLNVTTIVAATVPWVQCNPVQAGWDFSVKGDCWAPKVGTKVWIGLGAYSALMDFVLAALPWTFIYGINLRRKEKIGILIAMSMGVFAGGCAVAKCVKLPALGAGDSFNEVELFIWDITESCVCVIAACIPTLRALLKEVKQSSSQRYKLSNMTSSKRSQAKGFEEITVAHEIMQSREERDSDELGPNKHSHW